MPRTLLRITGSDRETFLQGLVTNDVRKLAQGIVYAAMLTPQGKYLADFFLVPDGDAILLDVDQSLAAMLGQRLGMYKLRADVQIAEDPRYVSQGAGPAPQGAFDDPRHSSLGWRAYGEESTVLPDWEARRVAALVPETGIELGPDSYILEVGFERLNGVDFKKGCYVGQEVTARMKHKTELRKGLALVAIDGTAKSGDEIRVDEKPAGTLHTTDGDRGIAYLRFDRLKGAAQGTAGSARITLA